MLVGQTSLPGSSTCFLVSINNDQPFALANEELGLYLIETQSQVVQGSSPSSLKYDPSTLAIVSVSTGLCLDDLGGGYDQASSTAYVAFRPCANSTSQQFIYLPLTHQILNPNNPYHKCLKGYPPDYMSLCDGGGNPGSYPWQRWSVFFCSPGEFMSTGIPPCSTCGPGNHRGVSTSILGSF